MHRGFLDKGRRHINLREMQVENVLPEHFGQYYPKFISLLTRYYEWQDQNNPNELLHHLFSARDINETDISLLSFIEDEFLLGEAYFEGFGEEDYEKRAAANFSNHLFRSKGTKFAIEWFFRSFYGLDSEVLYPKENVFTLNNTTSQIGPDSLRYLTNDKLYQTFALLVRVGVPLSKWKDVFKLFAHPAGMYLGAEVSIDNIISASINSVMLDSAATQRPTSGFTLVPNPTSIDEGGTIDFTVNATNLPEGIGSIYYYVNHGTTSDSDFVGPIPSSDSAAYLSINDNSGAFSLVTKIDDRETEGPEQFQVVLRDPGGRIQNSSTITINDVVSVYSLVPSSSLVSEGTSVLFTATGTNVPTDGTTLYYYVEHITTDSNDFSVAPPDSAAPLPFPIVDNVGSFSLTPVADGDLSDSGEQFKVIIQTFDGIDKDSAVVTVANTAPIFSVAAIGTIVEGNNLTASITADTNAIGDTLSWSITGSAASDGRLSSTSGSTVLTSTSQDVVVAVSSNDAYVGPVNGTFSITNANYNPDLTTTSAFVITDEPVSASIAMNPSIAREGDTVTFDLTGRNIQDGTYYFYIENITTENADFAVTPPGDASRESVTVTNNSGTTQSVTFSNNGDVVDQSFSAFMYDQATGGNLVASETFTIVALGYTIAESVTSVNEGGSVTFTFTGPDGTYYYWIDPNTGITSSDFSSGWSSSASRVSFVVSGTTGSFTVMLAPDRTFEGTESFTAKVSSGASTGAVIESNTITVTDTSAQDYTMSIPTITEGSDLIVNVSANAGSSEVLYFEISGTAASKFSSTQYTHSFYTAQATGLSTFYVNLGTSSTNTTHEGNPTGTVTLSRGGYVGGGGTLITSTTFIVQDVTSTFTLTADTTTPSEGGTINFTVGGTNIANGTYYRRITDIIATTTTQTIPSGVSVLKLADTSGITIGMKTNSLDVTGTVTFVDATTVTMSNGVSSAVSSGTTLQFANPSVFEDFSSGSSGTVNVTSNAGAFALVTATNTDTINDVYTMGLYTSESSNTPVASVGFTTTDATSGSAIDILINYSNMGDFAANTVIRDEEIGSTAIAYLQFKNDGTFIATGSIQPAGTNVQIGTWVTGTPSGNFTIQGDILPIPGVSEPTGFGQATGSYGTPLSLSSSRSWSLELPAPSSSGSNQSEMLLQITITDNDDVSNTDTQLFSLQGEAITLGTTEGGGTVTPTPPPDPDPTDDGSKTSLIER